jgi:hypothetical protein
MLLFSGIYYSKGKLTDSRALNCELHTRALCLGIPSIRVFFSPRIFFLVWSDFFEVTLKIFFWEGETIAVSTVGDE